MPAAGNPDNVAASLCGEEVPPPDVGGMVGAVWGRQARGVRRAGGTQRYRFKSLRGGCLTCCNGSRKKERAPTRPVIRRVKSNINNVKHNDIIEKKRIFASLLYVLYSGRKC